MENSSPIMRIYLPLWVKRTPPLNLMRRIQFYFTPMNLDKRIVNLHDYEYRYIKYMVEERFVKILGVLEDEVNRLGIPIPESGKCYKIFQFPARWECEEERKLDSEKDKVELISKMVPRYRKAYLAKLE